MKKLLIAILGLLPLLTYAQSSKATARPFFDKKTIGEIRITLPAENWADALDSMRLYGEGLMSGSASIDGMEYAGVGVRFRGNNSYQMGLKRNPIQIKLNHTSKELSHQGYTSVKLSSALRDPSMVREVLFHEIAGKYMPSPQANYVKLFINNEYVGVFINLESLDEQFNNMHYGSSENPYFKAGVDYKQPAPQGCKQNIDGNLEYEDNLDCYRSNFEMQSDRGWSDLQELTRVLNNDPKNIERVLDVDNTLWMLALNNVMVNLNSYTGSRSINYYLYKDNNGHFQPVHWDLNLSFGSFKNTGVGSDLDLKDLQRLDPMLHFDNPYKPLISQLLKDPLYKKIYLSHIRQIVEENFANGAYEKRAQELQGLIVVPFNEDKYKTYSLDDFKNSLRETIGKRSKIPGIVELMSKRVKYLKEHPELTALPSSVSDVTVQGRGKFENQRLSTFHITAKADRFPQRLMLFYRFEGQSDFAYLNMSEEASSDLPSGVKIFSCLVEAKSSDDTLEYYILAENAGTVQFTPSNYTSKPYKIKLSDLNK